MESYYKHIPTKEIKQAIKVQNGFRDFKDGMLAGHACRPLSAPCSVWFIRHGIKPNQITLLMILFGIVGSILFALPDLYCKIAGYLCWFLWFTMDLCDGQVARYTKTFSKYGTEMDYMAHLIDHPLMNLALWFTFLQMNLINPVILSGLFIICISIELIMRSITAFNYFHAKMAQTGGGIQDHPVQSWPKYLITQAILYPNMIVCFSWIIIVGYGLNARWTFWLFAGWLVVTLLLDIKQLCKVTKKYYTGNA